MNLSEYIFNRKNFIKKKISIKINKLFLFLFIFLAIPGVFLMRIVRPWIYIRVGTLFSSRIGQFVYDAGLRWAELSENTHNQIEWYWLEKQTSNNQWDKMVRRNFKVAWWVRHLDYWNKLIPGGEIHNRPTSEISNFRDISGILERTKACMEFLPEEDQAAKKWLRERGWQEGDKFVCLIVRDEAFLDSDPNLILDKGLWKYHSYRNSDISTYVSAMEWLADQGIWVLRMGKKMEKPIPSYHKRIIDYTFHSERNDFLDIWLFAHCNLCITTSTGPDAVSGIYRRPILFLNWMPIFDLWSWSNAMHVPKTLVWKESGKQLTCKEYIDHSYFSTERYHKAGIKIVNLTSKEILNSTQECWQRIEGKWKDAEEDLEQQKKFWKNLEQSPDFSKWHGWKHPNNKIGTTWLRNCSDSFFEADKH